MADNHLPHWMYSTSSKIKYEARRHKVTLNQVTRFVLFNLKFLFQTRQKLELHQYNRSRDLE